jgi:hypothetical protein
MAERSYEIVDLAPVPYDGRDLFERAAGVWLPRRHEPAIMRK